LTRQTGAVLVFGLLASFYIGATLLGPPGIYDEGLIVSGADRILRGQLPYVDFNSGYPPGQFYTIALVFRLFGTSLLAERIWDSLWRIATLGAAFWLARELAGKNLRWAPLACCAALTGAAGFRLYPMVTAALPCLCAIACALVFLRTGNPRWIFGCGLLLGCTAVYRHDLAVCAAVVVLATVWRDLRAVVWLAAGVLLVVGPAVAYLLAVIPRQVLWQAFVEFPRMNSAARHLPLTTASPFSLVRDFLLPLAIAGFTAVEALRAPPGIQKRLTLVAAVAALTLLLATQRLDTIHAFPSLVFCLVLLAGLAPSSLPRRLLIVAAVLFYGIFPLLEWFAVVRWSITVPRSAIARAGPVRITPDYARAVQFIQDRVAPGEAFYVGATSHSRVSFNDALFAFLAERPQATRFDMWVPGETNSTPVQSQIVGALENKVVRYVVLLDAPPFHEPNLSSVDNGIRIVDDYLARRYRQVAVFGPYRILQRAA
jgi:hypothetical protein